jgi:hypothetical protein
MDMPTVFLIVFVSVLVLVVLGCIVATVVVRRRIGRNLRKLDAEYLAAMQAHAQVLARAIAASKIKIRRGE